MEIILSKQCLSLTGFLRSDLGYYIRSTKTGRFYAQRSRYNVPEDGHLRFIFLCAELAQNGLHISNIFVSHSELGQALNEARIDSTKLFAMPLKDLYNAYDVLNLKSRLGKK